MILKESWYQRSFLFERLTRLERWGWCMMGGILPRGWARHDGHFFTQRGLEPYPGAPQWYKTKGIYFSFRFGPIWLTGSIEFAWDACPLSSAEEQGFRKAHVLGSNPSGASRSSDVV